METQVNDEIRRTESINIKLYSKKKKKSIKEIKQRVGKSGDISQITKDRTKGKIQVFHTAWENKEGVLKKVHEHKK